MTNCPVCGKLTCIHWPEHWVYRRGSTYYCGENCMEIDMKRTLSALNKAFKRRKDQSMTKITLEQKKKAVEIAISGGNPLEYLKKCGSRKPDGLWYTIKESLKKVDPDTYAKLPDYRGKTRTAKTPDQVATVKVDGPLNIETDKPEEINVHLTHEGAKIIGKVIAKNEKPIGFLQEEAIKNAQSFTAMANGDPKSAGPIKRMKRYSVTAIRYPEIGEFYYDQKFNQIDWRTAEGDEVSMSPTGWKLLLQDLPEIFEALGVNV